MKNSLRVGIVDFLNSRPLAWGFLRGDLADQAQVSYHAPAVVADMMQAGELDVGLLPSIELLRLAGAELVPGPCVAATQEVRSVLLVLRRPVEEVERLTLDINSRTSVALIQILLHDLWGVSPDLVVRPPAMAGVEAGFDGALLIGDPALQVDREAYEIVDLAAAWRQLTGHPFVFAAWATRQGVFPEEVAPLVQRSLAIGLDDLDSIVQRAVLDLGLPAASLREYLTRNLHFEMGPEERRGLEDFWQRATAAGIPAQRPDHDGRLPTPLGWLQDDVSPGTVG